MSNIELTSKIENIKTLQTMIDELTAEMESVKDEVKREMETQGVDEMTVSCFKVRYKEVKPFKSDKFEALYQEYIKRKITKAEFALQIGTSRPTLNKLIRNYEKSSHSEDVS